jgi:hypothetical protein
LEVPELELGDTLDSRRLIVLHVVIPGFREVHKLQLLLVSDLLVFLTLSLLHVDFLSLQLPLGNDFEVDAGPLGVLIPQLLLCLPAELVKKPTIIIRVIGMSDTYLMKSITLKSGTKYMPPLGSMLPNSFFIMSWYRFTCIRDWGEYLESLWSRLVIIRMNPSTENRS